MGCACRACDLPLPPNADAGAANVKFGVQGYFTDSAWHSWRRKRRGPSAGCAGSRGQCSEQPLPLEAGEVRSLRAPRGPA